MNAKDLLTKYRYLSERFNGDDYAKYYAEYKGVLADFLRDAGHMNDIEINDAVSDIINEVSNRRDECRWKFQKRDAVEQDKIVLLLFMAPALMDIDDGFRDAGNASVSGGGENGEGIPSRFAEELAKQWNENFPDSTFKIGRYEDIIEGFKWKLFSKKK